MKVAIIAGVILMVMLGVLAAIPRYPPTMKPGDEIVQVCKAPWFRRAREMVVRNDGHLFYLTNRMRMQIVDGTPLSSVCRSHGKVV